ncbi:MAG: hypothetical protein V4819_12085 [Verrucomicrobiota bacterium]
MKPLPAQDPGVVEMPDSAIQSLASALASAAASYSTSNRRAPTSRVARVYPWLLAASTAVAAAFCLMYITKPFIGSPQAAVPGTPPPPVPVPVPVPAKTLAPVAAQPGLMPSHDRLPGEKSTRETPRDAGIATRAPSAPVAFEQTNLRIQHILTAEAPGGTLARINLDVPVLYQSRNLRWTAAEVAEARALLVRLADYQDRSRTLRAEGAELLESWNRLIERSIPAGDLRADSPTLPANQQDAADAPRPAGLDTRELIQIQPAGK